MGACQSGTVEQREERKRSKEVERMMNALDEKEAEKVKLLLLGAGESGKSTIFKQMRVLYGAPLTDEEMKQVSPENKAHFDIIHDADENSDIDENLGSAIRELWKDLVARVRTSGIVTEKYVIDGAQFEMYDVGGQRNERKKWIHCFDDVTAIIFVAALSEYDQNLFEDSQTNRMVEAIDLFGEICNNRYFTNSSMILFLNKRDLYLEKIKNVHIGDQPSFSDFDTPFGHEDYYNMGIKYFTSKFKNVNENLERQIYHHATCATDSQNVEVVFNSCKEIILRGSMKDTFG